MQCTNRKELTATVTNQKECQGHCVQYSKCKGIAYSHNHDFMDKCRICENIDLESAKNDFGFYERAGNVQRYALKLIYVLRQDLKYQCLYTYSFHPTNSQRQSKNARKNSRLGNF